MNITRPTVSISLAQKLAGVSRRTIYNWLRDNKVEFVRVAGGNIRIFRDTLWMKGTLQRVPPPVAMLADEGGANRTLEQAMKWVKNQRIRATLPLADGGTRAQPAMHDMLLLAYRVEELERLLRESRS